MGENVKNIQGSALYIDVDKHPDVLAEGITWLEDDPGAVSLAAT